MIMVGDKKKALNQILGPAKTEEDMGAEKSALVSMAEELLDAVTANDPELLVAALKGIIAEIKQGE